MKFLYLVIFTVVAFCTSNAQVQIEPTPLFDGSDPSFSHDGILIAFVDKGKIWIYDLKTKLKKQVSTLAWDCRPKWSPDDQKLVFQSYGDSADFKKRDRFAIWLVNVDGTNQHKLIEEMKDGDQSPFWSPDGKQIAWTHGKQLWIADFNGNNARPLTKYAAVNWEYVTDWSKDSKTILYLRCDKYISGPNYYICSIDRNGNNQRNIGPNIYTYHVEYSEDEKSIYFIANERVDLRGPDGSLGYGTGSVNYLNKYNFSDGKILKNIFKIKFNNYNSLMHFNISMDFKNVIFDDSGPETNPKIYMMKLK